MCGFVGRSRDRRLDGFRENVEVGVMIGFLFRFLSDKLCFIVCFRELGRLFVVSFL